MDSVARSGIFQMHQFPMKTMALVKTGFLIMAAVNLVSCAAVKNATAATTAKISSSTAKLSSSIAKLPDLGDTAIARVLPGQRVKVVEVREQDLKEMPTGKEKAMAYRTGRRGFWIFGGPIDFKEPTLPEPGSELDGSLLPPRMP
jgi:hypothetical protein